jgi:hypothetical protein
MASGPATIRSNTPIQHGPPGWSQGVMRGRWGGIDLCQGSGCRGAATRGRVHDRGWRHRLGPGQ